MKRMMIVPVILAVWLGFKPNQLNSCTIVALQSPGESYAAFNLDYTNFDSRIWVVPASESEYARLCFGFDKQYKTAEMGINSHGLFVGVNSVDETNWKPDPGKPDWETWEGWLGTGVPDGILAKCKTVDEALKIFEKYNLLTFRKVKYLLADADGVSAVLEWSKKGLSVLRKRRDAAFQVSTNFVSSDLKPEEYSCYRYKIARDILSQNPQLSLPELAKAVLSTAAFEFNSYTQISAIMDLKKRTITVYLFHNFEDPLKINLESRLAQGPFQSELCKLFRYPSYSYSVLKKYFARK